MSDINYPLLRSVLQSIRNNPKAHNQGSWVGVKGEEPESFEKFVISHARIGQEEFVVATGSCQTTACIAGWTLLHSEYKADDIYKVSSLNNVASYDSLVDPEGRLVINDDIGRAAARHLGIFELAYDQVFMDMVDNRAVAQMMFLHDKGRLPVPVAVDLDDDGERSEYTLEDTEPNDLMDFTHLELDGQDNEEFTRVWYARFEQEFVPELTVAQEWGSDV